ncbi:hypothetical protein OIU76_009064 [Salix suchowensis]|nr:hypothetical protein OIU76_009064 [Salix suchowensis]
MRIKFLLHTSFTLFIQYLGSHKGFSYSLVTDVARVTDNPADQLVAALNNNRTAKKESTLYDNPGLGCIALQYIKAYQGDCGAVGGDDAKKPPDSQFADTFAPNCGVTASTLSQITGRLVACQSKYVEPSKVFSEILMKDSKSLEILYYKNHTEVGAGVTGTDAMARAIVALLWREARLKITRPGCFSGANDVCSSANWSRSITLWSYIATAFIAAAYVFGL